MRDVLLRELEKLRKEFEHESKSQVLDVQDGIEIAIAILDKKIKSIKEWSKYE